MWVEGEVIPHFPFDCSFICLILEKAVRYPLLVKRRNASID